MKIAYITPYAGEEEIVRELLSEHELIFIDKPLSTQIPAEAIDADVLSIFVDSKISEQMIDSMPNLKMIALRSTGFEHVAVAHAEAKGIKVSYVPHYGSQTVAEHTFALILALSRKAYQMYDLLRSRGNLDVEEHEGFDLCGKTIAVIGTGAIGKRVCEIALGFKMKVLAFDLYPDSDFAKSHNIEYGSLEEAISQADFVTLHVPSTKENFHLLDADKLAKCKKGAYIINTSRGTLIDTVALVYALKSEQIAGAGLDVYEGEEYLKDEMKLLSEVRVFDQTVWRAFAAEHELLDMDNVIITPHMAFNTKEAKREITETTVENIKQNLAGQPNFVVKLPTN
jgi:D-lactate dehydrogenase